MIIFAFLSYNVTQKKQARILFIICVLWTLVFGLRGYGVQNDTSPYATFISGQQYGLSMYSTDYGTVDNPSDDIELGYIWSCKLFTFLSSSPTLFFLLVAAWLFSLIYIIYRKTNPEHAIWCLTLFFSIYAGTVSVLMGSMRQVLSFCFLLTGYLIFEKQVIVNGFKIQTRTGCWYKNHKLIFAVFLLCMSIIVHRSAILTLFLFILSYFVNIKKNIAYILLVVAFMISVYFEDFLGTILDFFFAGITNSSNDMIEVMSRYGDSLDEGGISVLARFTRFITAIIITYFIDEKNKDSINFRCLIIATILFLLFSNSYIVNRIAMVFYLMGAAIIIPRDIKEKKTAQIVFVAMTFVFTYKAYDLFDNWPVYKDSFLPYYFIWE